MAEGIDLIGDIHGYADDLERLLDRMGYTTTSGVYRHADRKTIFLGDFIDGGEQNRRVLAIVRPMIESGQAFGIMGNHEYNAICYHTRDPDQPSRWLRSHSYKHRKQHETALTELEDDPSGLDDMVAWFRTLPLYLELGGLRAVHACWDKRCLAFLNERLGPSHVMDDRFLVDSTRKGRSEYEAVETMPKSNCRKA